ncbi:MAG: hypothetical protein MUD08_10910 [Cytophagales bacterium]|nr:hypothetical protein [Cytophagales bacterium]
MAHTVVGVFESAAEARLAVQRLAESGFGEEAVYMSRQTDDTTTDGDEGFLASVKSFFKSAFDGRNEDYNYDEVVNRHAVVTVYTGTEEEADRVADLLDEYGAVDVDERAAQYTNTITMSSGTIGPTGSALTSPVEESATDRVMQYADGTGTGRTQTGIYPNPVVNAGEKRRDNYERDAGNQDTRNAGEVTPLSDVSGEDEPALDKAGSDAPKAETAGEGSVLRNEKTETGPTGVRLMRVYRTRSRIFLNAYYGGKS